MLVRTSDVRYSLSRLHSIPASKRFKVTSNQGRYFSTGGGLIEIDRFDCAELGIALSARTPSFPDFKPGDSSTSTHVRHAIKPKRLRLLYPTTLPIYRRPIREHASFFMESDSVKPDKRSRRQHSAADRTTRNGRRNALKRSQDISTYSGHFKVPRTPVCSWNPNGSTGRALHSHGGRKRSAICLCGGGRGLSLVRKRPNYATIVSGKHWLRRTAAFQ